jgi:hypothetical protein
VLIFSILPKKNMDPITGTMLLSSIDQTLASIRAALAAGDDPQQTEEARRRLAERAGADIARLVASSRSPGWKDIPDSVSSVLERAAAAADRGDLRRAEEELTAGREELGGPSR